MAEIGGRVFTYRTAGEGPVLMLLHGLGGSSAIWGPQFEHFADTHRVIAWDAPGYGGSDYLGGAAPSPADYAEVLAAFFDAIEIERVHLVGQSMAALIAAAFCRLYPERVETVTFCHGVSGSGTLPQAERARLKTERLQPLIDLGAEKFAFERARAACAPNASPDVIAKVAASISMVPFLAYRQALGMLTDGDFFADAPKVKAPALVIAGSEDKAAPPASSRAAAKALKTARYVEIAGVGHYGSLEDPGAFNAALAAFLANPDTRGKTKRKAAKPAPKRKAAKAAPKRKAKPAKGSGNGHRSEGKKRAGDRRKPGNRQGNRRVSGAARGKRRNRRA